MEQKCDMLLVYHLKPSPPLYRNFSKIIELINTRNFKDHQTAVGKRNQQASLLLQLPPKIRNMIYTYVFSGLFWIIPRHKHQLASDRNLALLFVSRQIHSETALLPYALSIFVLNNDDAGTVCEPRTALGATRAF
jgi:hypothetical protein